MTKASTDDTAITPARPAATLILMRDILDGQAETLMVERSAAMAFAAGATVFPGGGADGADFTFAATLMEQGAHDLDLDDAAARIAALRETLEETGLAVALKGKKDAATIASARAQLHDGASFAEVCAVRQWQPDLNLLIPWARWEPPLMAKRRYDTRFYVANATHVRQDGWVDHSENSELFWHSASEFLTQADAGRLHVIFPTRRNLERLAQFDTFADAAAHAHAIPVRKIVTYVEDRADGRFLCIPNGHGYPICSEKLDTARRG